MTAYALRLTNGADTAERARQADTFNIMPAGPLKARSGVRPDGGMAVSVVAGTMQVRVAPGSAFVDLGATLGQGGYTFVVDGQPSTGETITLDNGDATGNRVDTVCAQVLHNVYDSSGNTVARIVAVKGNPATGVAPVIPAGHLPLRDVNVPQSRSAGNGGLAAANLGADRRVPTVSLGGIDPVASLDAANALPFKYEGLYVDLADTNQLVRWDGNAYALVKDWRLPVKATSATVESGSQTAWTVETNAVTATFIAPIDGRVIVHFSAYLINLAASGVDGRTNLGLRITGGLTRDPAADEILAARGGSNGGRQGVTYLLDGLTPGTSYTLTSARQSSAASQTAYAQDRHLLVTQA